MNTARDVPTGGPAAGDVTASDDSKGITATGTVQDTGSPITYASNASHDGGTLSLATGLLGPPSASAPLSDPQVSAAPEGSDTSALRLLSPQPLSTISNNFSTSVSTDTPRRSTKNHPDPLSHGPIPKKGSGQDRFRQLLKENNKSRPIPTYERSRSTSMNDRSRSTTRVVPTGANQQPVVFRSYTPDISTTGPPLEYRTATPIRLGNQETDHAVPMRSNSRAQMSPAIKIELSDSVSNRARPTVRGAPSGNGGDTSVSSALQHPLATARLSAQCQMRRFNPQWHETSGRDGYKCSVRLINKVIDGDQAFASASEAKQAVAEKALSYVCRLPCDRPAMRAGVGRRSSDQPDSRSVSRRSRRAHVHKESSANVGPTNIPSQYTYTTAHANSVGYNWNADSQSEQMSFLRQIQSLLGGSRPSPAVLSDPYAAQAFLQGLAWDLPAIRGQGAIPSPGTQLWSTISGTLPASSSHAMSRNIASDRRSLRVAMYP
ncbi:hypothetical protein GGS21DRAFT_488672 [Xylaria nigripes]|nr:hypothetical protein GGS21DRAFT_488672 [Xylaria nigripes]